jgi:hypothetical protein
MSFEWGEALNIPSACRDEENGSMATPSSKVRHLSVTILRDWQEVYAFAHLPENFPKWASGLAGSLHKNGVGWIAQTSTGQATVKFSELNEYGVLDHWVTPDGGEEIYIPLRVIPNGSGALVTLTLFLLAEHSPESYAKDAETVAKGLRDLKELLEAE